MKAKVLVRVDRNAALDAIRTMDALVDALLNQKSEWPKKLKRQYKDVRRDLIRAAGSAADNHGFA